jgi:hypothetical protein
MSTMFSDSFYRMLDLLGNPPTRPEQQPEWCTSVRELDDVLSVELNDFTVHLPRSPDDFEG